MRSKALIIGSALGLALLSTGCTTTTEKTGPGVKESTASVRADSPAEKRAQINAGYDATLQRVYGEVKGSRELVSKAKGVMVFPSVLAAGLVVGGEYGEGALRSGGRHLGYYRVASGSFGWQIGAQSKALVILFMTQEALDKFTRSEGWTVGADASVALLKIGANGEIDTNTAKSSVVAIALTNTGLMANLTVEGTKFMKMDL